MTTLSESSVYTITAQLEPGSTRTILLARLEDLQQQRAQAEAESRPPGACGDLADRSSSVEALIRLESIEARIVALELRLDDLRWSTGRPVDGSAARVGSTVTLSFGSEDSPETFRLDSLEEAAPGEPVITPESPLGQALIGARPGQQVTYRAGGSTLRAELLAIAA